MPSDTSPLISELEKSLQYCLIRDRHPVRNALQRLRSDANGASEKQLAKLVGRVEASQSVVALRSQPVRVEYPAGLPVSEKRDDILTLIKEHQVVVIAGETGSGKTTQLPKMCLEAGLGVYGRIGHTQPRRLAARSVAQRIADELHSPLGDLVGYQVRFTDQSGDGSRIKVMTDGILLAQTQHDRFLNEYDCIIIDEAHERSLNIDFLLGYLKQLLPKRPDLKVIITSATIDVERFSQHFDGAPVIQVSGRTFPVEMLYRPLVRNDEDEEDRSLYEGIADALGELRGLDRSKGSAGDTLVFLPGEREIRECADYLRRQQLPATDILPLYARLSAADQQKIFKPHGGRRVVLSTNVAETSLTVPGIRYVIDSGVARISRYSYRTKVQRLPVEAISQASANQRAGRCGRTEPGTCIRLYEESDFQGRPEFTDPEIRRTNLAAVILQMLNLRLGDIRKFPFVDAPDDRFVKDGYTLLSELGAVSASKKITSVGKTIARLPVDPRIGRMLIEAGQRNCVSEVMIVASALTVADPRERPQEKQQAAAEKHRQWADEESDFASLNNLWNGFEQQRQELSQNQLRKWCKKNFLSYMRMREWRDIHRQLHILLRDLDIKSNESAASYESLHKAILSGMLSHIGFRAEQKEYLGARNRRFIMAPGSAGYKKPPKWLVAAELVETSKLFARMVARIEPEWIEECGRPLLKYQHFEPHWQKKRGQVVASEQSSLYGLIVNPKKRVDYAKTHPQEARQILITEGLVAQEFDSPVAFYRKNTSLLEEVTEYEEKSRRRDLVIDDQALIDFYEANLPEGLYSRRDIEHWFKRADKSESQALFMTREFLLSDAARGISNDDYPTQFDINGVSFPLSYSFSPGAADDGVTLSVPSQMLPQIDERKTSWLVPGFVQTKVVAVIKALPKPIRKQFVPVPDTANDFLRKNRSDKGGLYIQLAEYLNQTLRPERVTPEELAALPIDLHLQMNYRVMSGDRCVAEGRDLSALKAGDYGEEKEQEQVLLDDRFDGKQVQKWDFGELPETTEAEVSGLPVRAYPCLKSQDGQVVLVTETSKQAAEFAHREGTLALIRQQLSGLDREMRQLVQSKMKPHWLLAKGLGNEADISRDLVDAVFTHVMLPVDEPLPKNNSEFSVRLERRSRLYEHMETLLTQYVEWLKIRHSVLKRLRGAVSMDKAMAFSDTKVHLERLLAPGFMTHVPWSQLTCFTRYLRAMEYRIEKLQGNLPRDRQAMIEFESLYEPWREARERDNEASREALEEFRWLLEEWRVSLFAQPLGTKEPVSLKRLNKRWQELVQAGL